MKEYLAGLSLVAALLGMGTTNAYGTLAGMPPYSGGSIFGKCELLNTTQQGSLENKLESSIPREEKGEKYAPRLGKPKGNKIAPIPCKPKDKGYAGIWDSRPIKPNDDKVASIPHKPKSPALAETGLRWLYTIA